MILNQSTGFALNLCLDQFQSNFLFNEKTVASDCQTSYCSMPVLRLLKRPGHNIPITSKFIYPDVSMTDLQLLYSSYRNLTSSGLPIEYGIIEAYDREGNILASSGKIKGYHQGLAYSYTGFIQSNLHLASRIALIKRRHTHPYDRTVPPDLCSKFSEPDLNTDKYIREYLQSNPNLAHIKSESYIIYWNPEFVFNHIFDIFQVLSDEDTVIKNRYVEVIGHRSRKDIKLFNK